MELSREDRVPEIRVRCPSWLLSREMPRHWYAGDPFASHFFNALSSTFPFGEAFFVRSVLYYRDLIDDEALLGAIRGFAGQEGQHSRLHHDHVEMLLEQGYRGIETRNLLLDRILRWHNRRTPRVSLAVTTALEHLTAILARQVLREPNPWIRAMHPEIARLWKWHALEEAEHKAVAFDVLQAVAPSHSRRVLAQAFTSMLLAIEIFDRMVYMLYKDGLLFRRETWREGWRFLFGRSGLLRGVGADYRAWYHRGFHPDQIDDLALIDRATPQVMADISS